MQTISIITPCYNSEKYIADTISSIINQRAVVDQRVKLDYIICDGGSTDNTLSIIKSFDSDNIRLISEKDKGMYDALAKGLRIANGEIIAYLNAGDYYSLDAFDIVCKIFEMHKAVHWITGLIVRYNEANQIISSQAPFRYISSLIRSGVYVQTMPYIQQESTFWRAALNNEINYNELSSFKLAGDYYLWHTFAKNNNLYTIEAYLGGFKIHDGQLSERTTEYLAEITTFKDRLTLKIMIAKWREKILWKMPVSIARYLNRKSRISYNLNIN